MTNNDADQKARRRVLRVECSGQMGLFKQARHPQAKHRESLAVPTLRFVDPDPETLALGDGSLRHYLASMSLGRAFVMRDFFDSLDWSAFDARYKPGGRPPYAPRRIVSLIIYGISVGCTSLRTLESLARRDLVAHWLTGGMCPDHSKIGRFINLHQRELSGALFESMTAAVLKEMPEINREISGDGTIIEAAASRYTRVKKEAIERWEHEAQKKSDNAPKDPQKRRELERARACREARDKRAKARMDARSGDPDDVSVNPHKPDAVIHKFKRDGYGFGYVPSTMVNRQRIIVAQSVDPTSEKAVLEYQLEQLERALGAPPERVCLGCGLFLCGCLDTMRRART